ncbi:ABC transporter ATP-binding protein [Actinopolymorpha sp. NPDC004070]|uniref:ABC transporter ATP-binding protein n=1 Tax=Actinopolymorpha sp. NPDC004070 TaxID=3154548 RepID=UPI0033B41830
MNHARSTAVLYARGARLAYARRPALAVATLALLATTSLLPVLQPWLLGGLVDRLGGDDRSGGRPAAIALLAVGYVLTLVLPALLTPVRQSLDSSLDAHALGAVDRHVLAAGARLVDLTRIERPAFHDEARRATSSASWVSRFAVLTQSAAGQGMTVLGLLLLVAGLSPWVAAALAVTVVPHLVAYRRMHRQQFQTMADQSRAAREMDYCVRLTTSAEGAKEVRVFGLGGWFLHRYQRLFASAYSEVRRLRLRHLLGSAGFGLLHACALGGGFWYVAHQAGAGRLAVGDVALYVNAVVALEAGLFGLSMTLGMVFELGLYLRQLFAFTDDAAPGIELPPAGAGLPAPSRHRQRVEFTDVTFEYPNAPAGSKPVLRGVNAVLPAGTVTAVVGDNGAGKSTLVKLLTRMYDPTDGQVLLDGHPLSAYDLTSLRAATGGVFQDFARFALTAGENIAVGAGDRAVTSDEVRRAARAAGADAVVSSLPDGYDTPLVRTFDGGVDLSGGQWQKLATARGLLRDAALVVLDEPTAALDVDAERRLFDTFRTLLAGRTGVLVSHRFSTVRMADQILVLENGVVVEAGSHAELLSLGGRYAAMFEMQAERYR